MAIRATDIYRTHEDLFDEEAIAMRHSGELSKNLRTAEICQKAKDSMALVRRPGPWMVLAGAGMCTGGRILNYLQNHLPDPTTLVLMVGYQSRGSVGRALAEGAKEVRIAGQKVKVQAKTHLFGGLSGHAGQSDLLNWFGSIASSRPRVILTHGEDEQRKALRDCSAAVRSPIRNACLSRGDRILTKRKNGPHHQARHSVGPATPTRSGSSRRRVRRRRQPLMSSKPNPTDAARLVSLTDEEAVKEILGATVLDLWKVVNNLTRLRPSKRDGTALRFRFGPRQPGTYVYDEVKRAAAAFAAMGCDIVTGGGPGLMQAANEGAKEAGAPGSVGIRVELPFEQDVNPFVEQAFEHETFFTRLHHFVIASDAFVVVPGGIGTVLEMLMIWQLLQVRHVEDVPLILVGKMWRGLVDWRGRRCSTRTWRSRVPRISRSAVPRHRG